MTDKHILSIACGHNHTVALSALGTVFSWGHNEFGQLGIGPTLDYAQPYPQLVNHLKSTNIVALTSGDNNVFALSESRQLYMWGWVYGLTGISTFPVLYDINCKISSIGRVNCLQNIKKPLIRQMAYLLNELYEISDLEFVVEEHTFNLHKPIIGIRCPAFLLQQHYLKLNSSRTIMNQVITFLYTGTLQQFTFSIKDLCELLKFAEELQLIELKALCENKLLRLLSISSIMNNLYELPTSNQLIGHAIAWIIIKNYTCLAKEQRLALILSPFSPFELA